jgi:hypothetical protein
MPAGVFNARNVRNSDGLKPKCGAVDVDLDLRRADVFKRLFITARFWRKTEITPFVSNANTVSCYF